MLRIFSGVSLLLGIAAGVLDVLRRSTPNDGFANCGKHSVICASGTVYHWASALGVAVSLLITVLLIGYPIIIAGRIGKRRNRRGYLAGIFFSWLGLLYIVLRKPRTGPDLLSRAVADYRGQQS